VNRRAKGTVTGVAAALLWSLLALFTTGTAGIPPLQVLAMSFTVAFAISCIWLTVRGGWGLLAGQPAFAWALAITGLFGYHAFYFAALANAPAVDASLIAYLWPLLIVVFAATLPGERVRWFHLAGAVMGLAGAALLITDGGRVALRTEYALGYAAAVGCALTWSLYSVLNRRLALVPTELIGGVCAVVAVLGWIAHAGFETFVMPVGIQWLALLALGLGPVGAAFFFWDYGTKHGNLPLLGALSYSAPLVSTLLLVAFGKAAATTSLALACALIVGGAVLASGRLSWRPRRTATGG
jgi:drug/metabolite transporter (DMT)-like permease